MKPRPVDPLRLDVESFAQEGGRLEGDWPLRTLERVADVAHPDAPPADADLVHWRAEG